MFFLPSVLTDWLINWFYTVDCFSYHNLIYIHFSTPPPPLPRWWVTEEENVSFGEPRGPGQQWCRHRTHGYRDNQGISISACMDDIATCVQCTAAPLHQRYTKQTLAALFSLPGNCPLALQFHIRFEMNRHLLWYISYFILWMRKTPPPSPSLPAVPLEIGVGFMQWQKQSSAPATRWRLEVKV